MAISNKNISKTKLREAISSQKYLMALGINDTPAERRRLEQWKKDLKEKERTTKPKSKGYNLFNL